MSPADVSIASFEIFKSDVVGKGYDLDHQWGYQCWDGLDLLWYKLGRFLQTGPGHHVYECWDDGTRQTNAGDDFDLIYDITQIKTGDVMIFGPNVGSWGVDGHGGYACEDYNTSIYIQLLSQNYRNPSATQGSPFSIDRVNTTGFLGAFRYKGWNSTPPIVKGTYHRKSNFPVLLRASGII